MQNLQPDGLLQIHTAPHRGSFTTVLTQALLTAGLGGRVLVSQLLKGSLDQAAGGCQMLGGHLRWLRPAVPIYLEAAAAQPDAEEAIHHVWSLSRQQALEGQLDQLVLDELGLAIELGYLPLEEVLTTLERRPAHLDVIITGPAVPSALMALADQITELRLNSTNCFH